MARKRKEPRLYAVKRPDGTLSSASARESKTESWEAYVDHGADPETDRLFETVLWGDAVIHSLRRLGYRVVEVRLVEVEK